MTDEKQQLRDEIKKALAGRTQRWLAMQIGLSDTQFSNKMLGVNDFSKENVEMINQILKTNISYE